MQDEKRTQISVHKALSADSSRHHSQLHHLTLLVVFSMAAMRPSGGKAAGSKLHLQRAVWDSMHHLGPGSQPPQPWQAQVSKPLRAPVLVDAEDQKA